MVRSMQTRLACFLFSFLLFSYLRVCARVCVVRFDILLICSAALMKEVILSELVMLAVAVPRATMPESIVILS